MATQRPETTAKPEVLRGGAVPLEPLQNKEVAVIGYGNQGRVHAWNLRDSGIRVRVGGRSGSAALAAAAADGFQAGPTAEVAAGADLVVLALPDEHHAAVWRAALLPVLRPGQTVGFLHGLSVHFGQVQVPAGVGCVLVAPKGPGPTLRSRFEQGQGIPALWAVHQECAPEADGRARALALAWCAGLGCHRAGVVQTTFRDEAVTDLFGEQAVLCGGMMALAQAAYDTLVEAGYPPMLAYLECVHEIKQVADILYERGPAGMRAAISNTAEFGAAKAEPRIADAHLRQTFRAMLQDIHSGAFARALADDAAAGSAWLEAQRAAAKQNSIEAAGHDVRALMPWLDPSAAAATKAATNSTTTHPHQKPAL